MRYLILDSMGNAVDAFRSHVAARATLRAIVEQEPDAADALVILAYDDQGHPVGKPTVFDDLPPAVRMESPWTFITSSGLRRRARRVIHSTGPDYVHGASAASAESPMVRSQGTPVPN
jgi:hypothetical protein